MKQIKPILIAPLWTLISLIALQTPSQAQEYILRYDQPAGIWEESLPLGNGHLGVTVDGGVARERLWLSENSIYRGGGSKSRMLDPMLAKLKKEKRRIAIVEGDEVAAIKLSMAEFKKEYKGDPPEKVKVDGFARKLDGVLKKPAESTLGTLDLFFAPFDDVEKQYERTLNLNDAIATTVFYVDGVRYAREVFCSYPDDVTVVKISSSEKGKISFSARLDRSTIVNEERKVNMVESRFFPAGLPREVDPVKQIVYGGDTIGFTGQAMEDGTRFSSVVKALATGGRVFVENNRIHVENADEAVLILSASTDYYQPADWESFALERVNAAAAKGYVRLREAHLADYREIFGRVNLSLGKSRYDRVPTDVRLRAMNMDTKELANTLDPRKEDRDPGLYALAFQFGRYVLISSSRKGYFFPGIVYWNPDLVCEWYGGHHDDINHQMNYWPADLCNMSETLEPVFDALESWMPTARSIAKVHYESRGFMISGMTPFGMPWDENRWPAGTGWTAQTYEDHYAFNRDPNVLAETVYPFVKGATLFMLDYLEEDPETGQLLTFTDWSPESRFVRENGEWDDTTIGATMSIAVAHELFTHFIEFSKILGVDEDLRAEAEAALPKLPPYQVNKYGGLQEWLKDFDEYWKGHRHLSPLYPLYPGNQISPLTTPELAEAAKVSLERRIAYGEDYGYVGWSRAWMLNLFARLYEPEQAHARAEELLRFCSFPNMISTHGMGMRSPDMKTNCIEGNMGFTAGIAEMLLQSHLGFVHLLPSLPTEKWPDGYIKGLKARGGYVVDVEWEKGKLTRAVIRSQIDGTCPVRYGEATVEVPVKAGGATVLDGDLIVKLVR